MNPDKLLCRHFWSTEQFLEFNEAIHIKKVKLYDQILTSLTMQADMKLDDTVAKNVLIDFVQRVGQI
jgi:hypothetical protein